jgi:beta-mannosidase
MPARRGERKLSSRRYLREGWACCPAPAGLYSEVSQLPADLPWIAAVAPGTVAEALRSAGIWSIEAPERRFDTEDWWFRTEFEAPADVNASCCCLMLEGLATLCDVWLNGVRILHSENMFLEHPIDRPPVKAGRNQLVLQFHALDRALKQRRARPRWRAPMVENQQLRWHRTTLLGRTPGWSPPAAAVGPWRPIWIDYGEHPHPEVEHLHSTVRDGAGKLQLRIRIPSSDANPGVWTLQLRDGEKTVATQALQSADNATMEAELSLPEPRLWWPHTHGHPALYEAVLCLEELTGIVVEHALGRVGFRSVNAQERNSADFEVRVNDTRIFCRGACWTPLDTVSLRADEGSYRGAIKQVVDAGFNMLRVSGSMVYEEELFFRLCDEYGVLVWQDFMFANMDYPANDEALAGSIEAEAIQQLRRWAKHPCVAVVCGNSEVSQQAAMWGVSRELWNPELFSCTLAALTAEHCSSVAYWPSSAFGGAIPHQPSAGTTSYYGVGAYLRGTDDLRRSGLKFASECLAFANIPEDETLRRLPGGSSVRVLHASWKQRSPRDLGAGWDFDDVRDHYVREFFGVDPARLRYSDHQRYLSLGREASALAMTTAFTEWRRAGSGCNGALIWFLRDLWPGAGWGIIDSEGMPKAPYHALRRALQPLWVGLTDEGLNGLSLQLCNETQEHRIGTLELQLYRDGRHLITEVARAQELPARSMQTLPVAELLDVFHDLTFAYRFGPLSCDLVVARWRDEATPANRYQTHYLPDPNRHLLPDLSVQLSAHARALESGVYIVTLKSGTFVRGVCLQADGFRSDDTHFWLAPGEVREVVMRAVGAPRALFGVASALNLAASVRIEMQGAGAEHGQTAL